MTVAWFSFAGMPAEVYREHKGNDLIQLIYLNDTKVDNCTATLYFLHCVLAKPAISQFRCPLFATLMLLPVAYFYFVYFCRNSNPW